MAVDLREVVLYVEQRFVVHLSKRFCFVGERVIYRVQLSRCHHTAVTARSLAKHNSRIVYSVVGLVKTTCSVLFEVAYNAVSSLSEDLIGGKHKSGWCEVGGKTRKCNYSRKMYKMEYIC